MTNLLFRHRVFASVNPSCVCNMFVVCVKRTVGILLSFSLTFLCILYVRLWSCFSRTISSLHWDVVFLFYIIHMQYLFVVFIFMLAIIFIAYHVLFGITNNIFYFHFDLNIGSHNDLNNLIQTQYIYAFYELINFGINFYIWHYCNPN